MPKRVFFLEGNTDGTVGGSYYLMYDLVCGLDRTQYTPIVGFHRDNFLVDRLRAQCIEVVLFPRSQPLVFRSAILNTVLSPLKKLVNIFRGFVGPALAQARFLRQNSIDLVNLNNSITRNHSWMLACMLTGTPCLTHEMGINTSYSFGSKFFGRRLKRIISLSHAIHDAMKGCGVDFPNIVVIHCGIDLARYRTIESPDVLRAKHGIPTDARIIGVVGNVRPWKGQETIVRAMVPLVARFPGLRCVLVGASTPEDQDYRDRLDGFCRSNGIAENVIFTGFQHNSIDYMQLMDVVVHTSVQPEPFGIVTLEAMARAKPLISTTIGGPTEVVVNGMTGLLVEPGKPELLAAAVTTMLSNMDRANDMGQKGYDRLISHFGLQRNLDETMRVYAHALGDSTP